MDSFICVCVCVYVEMIDYGASDNMIRISGKIDKSNTYKRFYSSDISFFIPILEFSGYLVFS